MAPTLHLGTDIKWVQTPHTAFCLLMWCTSVACWQHATLQSEGLLFSKPVLYVYFSHMTSSYIFVGISRTQIMIFWPSYIKVSDVLRVLKVYLIYQVMITPKCKCFICTPLNEVLKFSILQQQTKCFVTCVVALICQMVYYYHLLSQTLL